jgi:hypothetical protein
MNRFRTILAALTSLLAMSAAQAFAADPARSLAGDYGFMIGDWTCRVTETRQPDRETRVTYAWAYGGHLLRETVKSPDGKLQGEFLTSYDRRTDSFKGVGVGSWGGYVVWENKGLTRNRSHETGYVFADGKMTAISATDFEKVSERRYIFRDFDVDASGAKAAPTDTEDCVKLR